MSVPPTDIGNGVSVEYARNAAGERCGITVHHVHASDGSPCSCWVGFRGVASWKAHNDDEPKWDVLSTDPLTLSPSVVCLTCGLHGFVRSGRWQPV